MEGKREHGGGGVGEVPRQLASASRNLSCTGRAASSMQLIKFRMYVCRALGSKRVPPRKLVLGSTPPSSFRHAREQRAQTAGNASDRFARPLSFLPCVTSLFSFFIFDI